MAVTILKTAECDETRQYVYVDIEYGGDSYKHIIVQPFSGKGEILADADLQEYCDNSEDVFVLEILNAMYPEADVPQLEDKTALESFEAWIAGGAKNAEIKETRVTPAVPAADAVMGERQVTIPKEVETTEEKTEVVLVDGKYVEQTTSETVTNTVNEPQVTKHKLYNDAGEEIGEHEVPVMESYEITPAVEAVEETSETVVVRAESVVEKTPWKDTAE
tara:strand:+ start:280 stop:936 length:657 start_codon:yes stop_codon:yes gene_type:complete